MRSGIEIVPTEHPQAFVLRIDGHDQSHVDLSDPTRLAFDYVRRIGDVVDAYGEAGQRSRIVHVGGGALTLARYVAATRPTSAQIVLEPDESVTDLVRRDLPLDRRSGIKVRPTDGRTGTAALRDDSCDLLLLDAFAEARVPADLLTVGFFGQVARVLAEDGWFVANLRDRAPFAHTRRVVAGIATVWPRIMVSAEPATLRGRREGNLLVVASAATLPVAALRQRAASSPAPYRVLDAAQTKDSFGGGQPLVDG